MGLTSLQFSMSYTILIILAYLYHPFFNEDACEFSLAVT